MHPAEARANVGGHRRLGVYTHNRIAPSDINVAVENKRDGLGTERFVKHAVIGPDFLDRGLFAAGQHSDLLSRPGDAAGELAAQATEVMKILVRRVVRTTDPLYGKTQRREVP